MGYLVYCTTCNGTMSNNAHTCPHCGEYGFIQRKREFESRECSSCKGRGKYEQCPMFGNNICKECHGWGTVNVCIREIIIDKRKKV